MAPKLSNQDEPDHDCVGQPKKNCSNFIGRTLAVTVLCDRKEYQEERSRPYHIASAKPNGGVAQCSSDIVERIERPQGQDSLRNKKKKKSTRRKFSLPIHNPKTYKDTSLKRRRWRKQQMSLDNFFQDENQELRFRFGTSYQDFVLPLGVEPSTSCAQARSFEKKMNC